MKIQEMSWKQLSDKSLNILAVSLVSTIALIILYYIKHWFVFAFVMIGVPTIAIVIFLSYKRVIKIMKGNNNEIN